MAFSIGSTTEERTPSGSGAAPGRAQQVHHRGGQGEGQVDHGLEGKEVGGLEGRGARCISVWAVEGQARQSAAPPKPETPNTVRDGYRPARTVFGGGVLARRYPIWGVLRNCGVVPATGHAVVNELRSQFGHTPITQRPQIMDSRPAPRGAK